MAVSRRAGIGIAVACLVTVCAVVAALLLAPPAEQSPQPQANNATTTPPTESPLRTETSSAVPTPSTTAPATSAPGVTTTRPAPPPPPPPPPPPAPSPFTTTRGFYVNTDSAAAQWTRNNPYDWRASVIRDRIAGTATARWFLRADDVNYVGMYVQRAAAVGQLPVLVAYYLTQRDCGSYSAGGAPDDQSYRNWIGALAKAIGPQPAVIVLEPDSLFYTPCLRGDALERRLALVREAVSALRRDAPNTFVYLDGGTPVPGTTAEQLAGLLARAGVAQARGFAVNINNFVDDTTVRDYARAVATALRTRHGVAEPRFVMDTSRNGRGSDGQWCNPAARRLGQPPGYQGAPDGLDSTLWIKNPGESDGSCGSAAASNSGDFVPDLAYSLATS